MKQGLSYSFLYLLFFFSPIALADKVYHSLFEQGVTTSSFQTGDISANQLRWVINLGIGADFAEEYRVNFRVGYSPVFTGDVDGNDASANDFLFALDGSYLMPRQERLMYVGGQVLAVLSDAHVDSAGSERQWWPDFGVLAGVEHGLGDRAAVGVRADVLIWRGLAGQLSTYLLYRF